VAALVFFESASELATLTNTFSVDDVPTDPTTISLIVTDPEGAATTYTFAALEITKTSTGVYTKDITCDKSGDWMAKWIGTGTVVDTEVVTWTVQETALGGLHVNLHAVKSRVGIEATDTRDDFELHFACFAASRMAEHYCQRLFRRTATTWTFVPDDPYCLRLPEFSDIVSVTTLKTDASGGGTFDTTWAATDYQLLPHNPTAAPEARPYTKIKAVGTRTFPLPTSRLARDDRAQIAGIFGWPKIPYSVRQSGLITAAEVFRSKSTFEAQAGYDEMVQFMLKRNPFALDLLKPYRRHALLVA
jgi:hypothetical protein